MFGRTICILLELEYLLVIMGSVSTQMTNSLYLTKVVSTISACSMQVLQFYADRIFNKTG